MEKSPISPEIQKKAYRKQRRADFLTDLRANYSFVAGRLIAATNRNWPVTALSGGLEATDAIDGYDAKGAQRLLNTTEPLTNGAKKDPIADKIMRREFMKGMLLRAVNEGDILTSAVISAKTYIDNKRDQRMEAHRNNAAKYTDLSIGALQINRAKTFFDMSGILLNISPLANRDKVRHASLGMMALGSTLGLIGERQYGKMVNSEMDKTAAMCPNELDYQYTAPSLPESNSQFIQLEQDSLAA